MQTTLARRAQRLALAASLSAMIGCAAVGPDYQGAPELDLPDLWSHQYGGGDKTQLQLERWWQNLGDPLLSDLIARANRQSLDLRIALARVQESRAKLGVVDSQYWPTVDAGAQLAREKTSGKASIIPQRVEDYHGLSASLGWELDLFGRIRRQSEAASAAAAAEVENYRDVMVLLNAEIARSYINVRTLQERLRLANTNVATQRESVRVVKARYRAELTSELDLNQARQNLARTESAIPQLEAALAKSINRIAVLLGRAPGALNAELAKAAPIPMPAAELVTAPPRDVLRQRPDVRRAERRLAAQTAKIGVATAELYPKLALKGNFGFATLTGSLFSSEANAWSFGPGLSWNIFDRGRARANIAIEDALAEQARAGYEKTVLSAFEDVEAGLINYHQEQRRLVHLKASTQAAKNTVTIAKSQYRNGLTNFQTVLDAERVLFAEQDNLARSRGALVGHLIGIYRAMGGGWNSEPRAAEQ